MKIEFITTELKNGEYLRYKITADTLQKAFEKGSKLGIVKGHNLRTFSGKYEPFKVYKGCNYISAIGVSHVHDYIHVCELVEDYWQPDSLTVYRQSNGLYTIKRNTRQRENIIKNDMTLLDAYNIAKDFAKFNMIPFKWFHVNYAAGQESIPLR